MATDLTATYETLVSGTAEASSWHAVSLTRAHGLRRRRDRPQSSSNWNRIPFGPLLGVDSDALPAKIRRGDRTDLEARPLP